VRDPVLQLHRLALQAQQLAEIEAAVDGADMAGLQQAADLLRQAPVVDLLLQLLVEIILELRLQPGPRSRFPVRHPSRSAVRVEDSGERLQVDDVWPPARRRPLMWTGRWLPRRRRRDADAQHGGARHRPVLTR
jgi:hypothetical protein